jgi:hypothetical protein
LNGKTAILEEKHKWPGQDLLRDSKAHLPCSGEALVADLSAFLEENPNCTLLQYMDDLLLASHHREKCWEGTNALLA